MKDVLTPGAPSGTPLPPTPSTSTVDPQITIHYLKERVGRLSHLADHYIPGEESRNDVASLMREFGLEEDLDNPFYVQNRILVLLDEALNDLQRTFQ